ncbi:hypothetical protein BMF94_4995 [Rhodotorula taiwanensis]|uniref:TPR-like protein n=1 Tax=Rhodotorula taiwanensis TaxID=741276 RepID=A0A2S5B5F5_9BASI|nr:hypothetical protein BMF94_4995 [Rhodotorula taiwanensis]
MSPSLHLPHPPHHHAPTTSTNAASHAPPASQKGQHYAETLDSIRRLALWTSQAPALAKGAVNYNAVPDSPEPASSSNGASTTGMEWNEVLRKFRKHNPNRTITAATAHCERTLRCLLAKARTPSGPPSSAADPVRPPPLPAHITSSDRPAATEALAELQATLKSAQGTPVELDSAGIVLAFGKWAIGEPDQALAQLQTGVRERGLPQTGPWEAYDLTLRVLALALQGHALESLVRQSDALVAYIHAGQLYEAALAALSGAPNRDSDDVSLHRVGGDVLVRIALLSRLGASASAYNGTTTDPSLLETSYSAHRSYLAHSSSFSRSAAAFPLSSLSLMHRSFRSLQATLSRWNPAVISHNNRAEERILRRTTRLPKAGETNREYLRFLDEVVETWKLQGAPREGADEVIEILYNALTHTFQSQLLLRHLVRALTIVGRHEEAAKALRLYRELWDKARETDAKEVAKEMRELRTRAMREASGGVAEKAIDEKVGSSADGAVDEPYAVDIDSDGDFVETVVFGVRLLCRYFDDRASEAVEIARRAKAICDDGKDERLKANTAAQAAVERALGVALGALARQDPEPTRRAKRHAESLEHLRRAVSLNAHSSGNHFSLAYHELEQRRVQEALEAARQSVRLDPSSKEAWHLLALCASAQKDMRGALEVLETAIDLTDSSTAVGTADGLPLPNGDAAPHSAPQREALRQNAAKRWDQPLDETERLATEVQLRLTKNAVIEYLEGASSALADQQEVLAYFSSRNAALAPASPAGSASTMVASDRPVAQSKMQNLAAPSAGSAGVSRAGSILSRHRSLKRKSQAASTSALSPLPPLHAEEAAAVSTPARSVAGTSTAASVATAASNRSPTTAPTVRASPESSPLASRSLASTWLASAASFRRGGKLEEARGAISEAEAADLDNPDVWTQYALVLLAKGDVDKAKDVLDRAMALNENDVTLAVIRARMYLTPSPASGSDATSEATKSDDDPDGVAPTWKRPLPSDWVALHVPLAEAMLETLTERDAYDSPEAWFELSRCYKLTGRPEDERRCLVEALNLERSRPIRTLGKALERCL